MMASKFSDFNIPLYLLARIPFESPTPVQAEAIPYALDGKDILATSQTGSGKTIAFGIPLISRLTANPQMTALILTPTRELAIQVANTLRPLSRIRTALLIGGQSYFDQYQQLNSGARLIVGTPGRVNDHLNRHSLALNKTQILVLDEADRMLDMGFGPQVNLIVQQMPQNRQTLMFSATFPREIEAIAKKYLYNPARIRVDPQNEAPPHIEQRVVQVPTYFDKRVALKMALQKTSGNVLVFANTQWITEKIAGYISTADRPAHFIHGNLPQWQRDKVMRDFRDETVPILVATDVVGRGVDILQIRYVVNYDLPHDPSNYVHRIGRTARAGATGEAINILAPQDVAHWNAICRHMRMGHLQIIQRKIPLVPRRSLRP
jgi:ATP-dependent RNA helicase DeaD